MILFPAVRILIIILLGITLPEWIHLEYELSFILFLLALILTLVGEILLFRSPSPPLTYLLILGYHVSLLWFSTSHSLWLAKQKERLTYLHHLNSFHSIPLQIHGRILQVYLKKSGDYRVLTQTSLILLQSDTLTINPVKISLNWPEGTPKPEMNAQIKATIRIKEGSELKNPFVFNYQAYLHQQGIYYSGDIDHIDHPPGKTAGFSLLAIKGACIKSIEALFSPSTQALAQALILGDKGILSETIKEDFKRSGLSHLMAVSGLHVIFVVSPLLLLIPLTHRHIQARHLLMITIAIVLFIYSGVTGNTASVLRAAIMFGIYSMAKIYRWLHHGFNTLAISAIVLLLFQPVFLWDVGFQLSYLAVIAILLSNPLIQQLKPKLFDRPVLSHIWDIAGLSLMIQVALTPLLLFHFGTFSLTGIVLNLPAIPLTQGILTCSMLLLGLHAIGIPVDTLATLTDYAMQWLLTLTQFGGSWTMTQWDLPGIHWSLLLCLFILFLVLVHWNHHWLKWKLVNVSIFLLLIFQTAQIIKDQRNGLLNVLFLDVGQGDAAIVWSDPEHAWLIDTGLLSSGYNSGEAIIWPVIQQLGIRRLNKVILSHPHLDHIGGIHSLLSLIPIDTLYEADVVTPSVFVFSYRARARLNGTRIKHLKAGDQLYFNTHTRAYILAPEHPITSTDLNAASIMLKLQVGQTAFLFTGDADIASETAVVDRYGELLSSTVLKCGHHGSKTSTSEVFLKKVNPKLVVVSLGWKNRYQHPHPEVIARIKKWATHDLHFTSLQGALWLKTDGKVVTKQSY